MLALRILATTLTTRISMDDGKSHSGGFQDLWWDRESRLWREPWAKERNGNERIPLRIRISIEFLDHLILATLWATIRHRLMQDHRTWDRILIIRNSLVCSPGESLFWSWPRRTNVPDAMSDPSPEPSQLLDRVNSPTHPAWTENSWKSVWRLRLANATRLR